MASLNVGAMYSAVHQSGGSLEEREESLMHDYWNALDAYKKTKEKLLFGIVAIYAFLIILEVFGAPQGYILGAALMNIVAWHYGGYAHYELIEKARYNDALKQLHRRVEDGE